jgi:uncharacterized caspase-like protein
VKYNRRFPQLAARLALLAALVTLASLAGCSLELDYDKYAIVYAVSDYQDKATDLPTTEFDANEFTDLLEDEQGFQVITRITNDGNPDPNDATDEHLEQDFDTVAAMVSEDDLFVFYFSGHGSFTFSGSPEKTENSSGSDSADECIVLVNFDSTDLVCYTDDQLATQLAKIDCVKKVVIIDACFSGGLIGNELEVDMIPPSLADDSDAGVLEELSYAISLYANFDGSTSDITPENALVIAACGEAESSYEWPEKNNGVMTYFLLESAVYGDSNNDGYITVLEAYDYIRDSINSSRNPSSIPFAPHVSGGPVDYILFTK